MFEPGVAEAAFSSAFTEIKEIWNRGYAYQAVSDAMPNEFGNLEEFLYKNEQYQKCTTYIQSLENFHSNEYYITYLIKAYIKMGDYSSARTISNLYVNSRTSDVEKDATLNRLNKVIETTKTDKAYMTVNLLNSHQNMQMNPSYEKNRGQCMIASKNVEAWETILIEELSFSTTKNKCAHCFKDILLLTCCKNCNRIYYCSEDCLSNNKTIHNWECGFYKINDLGPHAKMTLQVLRKLNIGLKQNAFTEENNFNNVLGQQPALYKSAVKDFLMASFELTAYIFVCHIYPNSLLKKNQELFQNTDYYSCCVKLGGLLLKLLIFYKYKSVYIFDNVFGISTAYYSTLSMFRFSCQPNTTIRRIGSKIILKASKEIKKGEEIFCSYFDMGDNTTFLDVILNNEVEFLTLGENCESSCQCNKSPYNCVCTNINNIDDDCELKQIPARNKCLLQIIILNFRTYSKSRNPELLHSTFEIVNKIILNKNHLLYQGFYFEIIKHKISLDDFHNVHEYLPIIMNTSSIQFFKRSHMEICSLLVYHTKSIFTLETLQLSFLDVVIDYLKFLEEQVYPRYPNEILLGKVKTMQTYYMLTRDLKEPMNMKASVA